MFNKNLNLWLNANIKQTIKDEINNLDSATKADSFYTNLVFGTAGVRGKRGWGTNRMNLYNIRMYSQAYSQYLVINTNALKTGIIIGYDNRHMSREFAQESAQVFGKRGIKVYFFPYPRPTPQLSWAIRHMQLAGGLILTASHNPPEYNGYKIYDDTGCQMAMEKMLKLKVFLNKLSHGFKVPYLTISEMENQNLIEYLDDNLDDEYIKQVKKLSFNPITKQTIKIAYTSQHGAAGVITKKMFDSLKIDVDLVASQFNVDPDFTNAPYPNPEDDRAYEEIIKLGKVKGSDLLISTDPDGDRIGIVVFHHGTYKLLSGNQSAAILLEYVLSHKQATKSIPSNAYIINTIVTSTSGDRVAAKYGVKTLKTLTGFKWIGSVLNQELAKGNTGYICGYEESYGFLPSQVGRDKDSLQSALLFIEACQYYQKQGKTLYDVLQEIYQEIGYYQEISQSIVLEGQIGKKQIEQIMTYFAKVNPQEIIKNKVTAFVDYQKSIRFTKGKQEKIIIPATAAYKICFNEDWIIIRPSGTEPKLKIYYCVYSNSVDKTEQKYQNIKKYIKNILVTFGVNV